MLDEEYIVGGGYDVQKGCECCIRESSVRVSFWILVKYVPAFALSLYAFVQRTQDDAKATAAHFELGVHSSPSFL